MKSLFIAIALIAVGTLPSHSADMSCESQAAEKNLHGAAKTSFTKKCAKDSKATTAADACAALASDKKLAGAAKNSYIKKCIKDAAP